VWSLVKSFVTSFPSSLEIVKSFPSTLIERLEIDKGSNCLEIGALVWINGLFVSKGFLYIFGCSFWSLDFFLSSSFEGRIIKLLEIMESGLIKERSNSLIISFWGLSIISFSGLSFDLLSLIEGLVSIIAKDIEEWISVLRGLKDVGWITKELFSLPSSLISFASGFVISLGLITFLSSGLISFSSGLTSFSGSFY